MFPFAVKRGEGRLSELIPVTKLQASRLRVLQDAVECSTFIRLLQWHRADALAAQAVAASSRSGFTSDALETQRAAGFPVIGSRYQVSDRRGWLAIPGASCSAERCPESVRRSITGIAWPVYGGRRTNARRVILVTHFREPLRKLAQGWGRGGGGCAAQRPIGRRQVRSRGG